jgi:hypothetical protein
MVSSCCDLTDILERRLTKKIITILVGYEILFSWKGGKVVLLPISIPH